MTRDRRVPEAESGAEGRPIFGSGVASPRDSRALTYCKSSKFSQNLDARSAAHQRERRGSQLGRHIRARRKWAAVDSIVSHKLLKAGIRRQILRLRPELPLPDAQWYQSCSRIQRFKDHS